MYKGSETIGDNMYDETPTLRAVVSQWKGGLQAQLLELDIAVQGSTHEQILAEFAHAITVSYEVAVMNGETPFVNLGMPPKSIQRRWKSTCPPESSIIELRDEVASALAAFLQMGRPIRRVTLEAVAA
jgi:hypothetical protein